MAERVGFEPTVAKGDTRSPGAPVRPLQHLSVLWRRGWDSNPRGLRPPLFESGTINHSDTSPKLDNYSILNREGKRRYLLEMLFTNPISYVMISIRLRYTAIENLVVS